jgi:hypothetical protein
MKGSSILSFFLLKEMRFPPSHSHWNCSLVCILFMLMSNLIPATMSYAQYPTTMAALEAWRQCGGKQALQNLADLKDSFVRVLKASEQDDEKDEDGDGVSDYIRACLP